jgi:hypothetical protein
MPSILRSQSTANFLNRIRRHLFDVWIGHLETSSLAIHSPSDSTKRSRLQRIHHDAPTRMIPASPGMFGSYTCCLPYCLVSLKSCPHSANMSLALIVGVVNRLVRSARPSRVFPQSARFRTTEGLVAGGRFLGSRGTNRATLWTRATERREDGAIRKKSREPSV